MVKEKFEVEEAMKNVDTTKNETVSIYWFL